MGLGQLIDPKQNLALMVCPRGPSSQRLKEHSNGKSG